MIRYQHVPVKVYESILLNFFFPVHLNTKRDIKFHDDLILSMYCWTILGFFVFFLKHSKVCAYKLKSMVTSAVFYGEKKKINIHSKYKTNILAYYYLSFRNAVVYVLIFCEYLCVYYSTQRTLCRNSVDNKRARYGRNKVLQNVLWNIGTSTTVFTNMNDFRLSGAFFASYNIMY